LKKIKIKIKNKHTTQIFSQKPKDCHIRYVFNALAPNIGEDR
jgi:hypothetical protein